jgi:hypothetical protein
MSPKLFPAHRPTVLKGIKPVLLRVITGDSLAGVKDAVADGTTVASMVDRSPLAGGETVVRRSAFYWSKFFHKLAAGEGGFTGDRKVTALDEGDNYWAPLHSRQGWNDGGPFSSLNEATDIGMAYLVDYWMRELTHGYVDETGAEVPVYYIHSSFSNSSFGTSSANGAWDSAVDGVGNLDNTPYRIHTKFYVEPALAALRAISQNIYCDMYLHTAGGVDTVLSADALALDTNLVRTMEDLQEHIQARPPLYLLRPYINGLTNFVPEGQASFDAAVAELRADLRPVVVFEIDGSVERQEFDSLPPGVHPTADGSNVLAKRIVLAAIAATPQHGDAINERTPLAVRIP